MPAKPRGTDLSRGGSAARATNTASTVSVLSANVQELERMLLQRGVGALQAERNCCADCGRTPLTGEQVHLYAGREGAIVCELCRWRRREAPVASELVRHCEHGHAVRLTVRVGERRAA